MSELPRTAGFFLLLCVAESWEAADTIYLNHFMSELPRTAGFSSGSVSAESWEAAGTISQPLHLSELPRTALSWFCVAESWEAADIFHSMGLLPTSLPPWDEVGEAAILIVAFA